MSMDLIAFIFFGFTILERIVELVVSKQNQAWSFARGGVEYGESHYKWMVLMHAGFLLTMLGEFFSFQSIISNSVRMVAIFIAAICQLFRWWIIKTLGRQWNTRVIIVPGLSRITAGPYRYLKHPNYLVVAVETFVLPLIFGSWRTAVIFSVLNAFMMRVRIRVENDALNGLRST